MTGLSSRDSVRPVPRTCLACGVRITERHPVFLVGTPSGRIVGPYHPWCAKTVVARARGNPGLPTPDGETFGRLLMRGEDGKLP